MKRLIRIVSLIALCAMVAITFSGCYKDWLGKRPCDQYNTAWKSEDGSIHFYIGSGWGIGMAEIGDEKKEFQLFYGNNRRTTLWKDKVFPIWANIQVLPRR